MTKYHIRKDGTPGVCRAKIKCRLTSEDEHGTTPEEARRKHETALAKSREKILVGAKLHENVPSSQRPRAVQQYRDRKFPVPENVVEVPHNPDAKYAVLSDVDGTLTRGSLVLDHAIYLHQRGIINLEDLPERWVANPKNEKLIVSLAEKYRSEITGMKIEDLHINEFLNQYEKIDGKFYSTMNQLRSFKKKGWEVQLISGSPNFLVQPFAERNGFYGRGSEYHVDDDGRINGDIEGMFGHEAKEGYISQLKMKRFKRVLAFGDTASDVPLFNSADHSTLVDPSEETEANVKATVIIRE